MSETVPHNEDSSSTSLGAVLRRCREYHGISIDEAAEATKMGKNYLLALENDRTKEFANQAYLKGFLRIYAGYLGLNPDDMLRLHDKQQAQGIGLAAAAHKEGARGGAEIPKKRISLRKFALPAFLLLLIVITASIINRSDAPPRREQIAPQVAPLQPVPTTVPVPAIQPVRSSAHPPPPPQKKEKKPVPVEQSQDAPPVDQKGALSPAEQPKSFIVRMKVSQNGTLNVTIDGALSQTYDLTAGDAIEWKAEKNIALELSNAGGVEVEVNGKPLKALGPVGKPVSIELDANGIRP
ncbi:helix-turn-helix domain-containing protein [Geobacter sp. AOG2]|uniref:helix-turn-helix domain-containing protein n=1 Tax=Geobacter sp. AOG2 TaxID=1566347 RepID=UPI001CC47045|nr:helix-turn-helix domain-containing protein [Geobacter sp. AOG2]GFE61990.1 DNA-binding protein [Geobacter sp. AOG2]